MQFAIDYNDNKIHIHQTHSNQEYYCPYCGASLITKKGEIRQHHFAHKKNHPCSDTWECNHSYDMSPWHNAWQSQFPKENQEIKLSLGNTVHRADVMVDRTVIEFQHSVMSVKFFDDRNNFYLNLGKKVVWLFDLSDLFEKQIFYKKIDNGLEFHWKNPKKAFNSYDVQSGCVDLFFQLNINSNDCIVRVTNVSENGFECFYTSDFISKNDFLSYIGLKNGHCLPPCREDIENDKDYRAFKEKYRINLNRQQERAMLAVEGSVLLLAVPGSGKTTVLIDRLGHMIINKNISPENILSISYNTSAAQEMKERFLSKFGQIGNKIDFRTINSLALKIYSNYCAKKNIRPKKLLIDNERRQIIFNILESFSDEYGEFVSESDILTFSSAITYIKNMMLSDKEICDLEAYYPKLLEMYNDYQKHLENNYQMDFDDQMIFALEILKNDKEIASALSKKYKYICVDEAQDTSKIQHEIIRIIAYENNIFMVGDEDQSIYGFRAAYPKALLNFRYDYRNPYILRMERNYRSTKQIVDKAQSFISRNKGRYEKQMTAEYENGEAVELIKVDSRKTQYMYLLEIAKNAAGDTAFLYRDNESSIVLADMLTRNGIQFNLKKPVMKFFKNKVVKDIISYLSLAIDEYDFNSFDQICNKGIFYLPRQQRNYAILNCKRKHMSIFDSTEEQMQYLSKDKRDRANKFKRIMYHLSHLTTSEAMDYLMQCGYEWYLKDKGLDVGKVEILHMLSVEEPDIKGFLERLKQLENLVQKGFDSHKKVPITLSTIHSSKGAEYNNVYMVDIYDGRFPSSIPNIFNHSKDNADIDQEERRLFYVGITRAKNSLHLFSIDDKKSVFVNELFDDEMTTRFDNQRFDIEAREGMEFIHIDFGKLLIIEVEKLIHNTIIRAVDSNGELFEEKWEELWKQHKIKSI